jgi:hypothetical protein
VATTTPIATRTVGASHPRSSEYLRKKIAASTSAMPATAENSLTPTSCSQSNALSLEAGPAARSRHTSGGGLGATWRGSVRGGVGGGTAGGCSGGLGGGATAFGGAAGGGVAAGRGIGGGVTGGLAATGGTAGSAIGAAGATASLFSCVR